MGEAMENTTSAGICPHGRHFGEVAGDEIYPADLAARATGAAVEKGNVADVPGGLRIEVTELADRQDLGHLDVAEIAPLFG